MEIKGKETKQVTVNVEPADAVKALIQFYGFGQIEWSKGNYVGYSEDISRHGSPCYEYYGRKVTDFELDMYKTLKHLQELIHQKNYNPDCEFSKYHNYLRMTREELKSMGMED